MTKRRSTLIKAADLRQILDILPDDCYLYTHSVGNLGIITVTGDRIDQIGYIEMQNVDCFDGSNYQPAELTLTP